MNTPQHKRSLFSLATMTAYLNGELDPETVQAVEAELTTNVDYAEAMEALDREQTLDEPKAFANREQFEKSLRSFLEQQVKSPAQPVEEAVVRKFPIRRWLAVAAVVLLLFSPFIYQFLRPKATVQQISMAYLDAYAFSGTKGISNVTPLLDTALIQYNQGRQLYQENKALYQDSLPTEMQLAKERFIHILARPQDEMGIRQYLQAKMGLGVCFLLEGYPQLANEHFAEVIQHGNNEWVLDAAWYQAWALLHLGQKEKAIERFFELSRQKGIYRTPAQNILDEIE